jgi:hypothetical protein
VFTPLLLPPATITLETGRPRQPDDKKTKSNFKMMQHQMAEHSPDLFEQNRCRECRWQILDHASKSSGKSHSLIATFMQIAVRTIIHFYERSFNLQNFPSTRGISLAQKHSEFEAR